MKKAFFILLAIFFLSAGSSLALFEIHNIKEGDMKSSGKLKFEPKIEYGRLFGTLTIYEKYDAEATVGVYSLNRRCDSIEVQKSFDTDNNALYSFEIPLDRIECSYRLNVTFKGERSPYMVCLNSYAEMQSIETAIVKRIVKGNVIELTDGRQVRLNDVFPPDPKGNEEKHIRSKPFRKPNGFFGHDRVKIEKELLIKVYQELMEYLKNTLEGKEVLLEYENGLRQNKHGQYMAYVFLPLDFNSNVRQDPESSEHIMTLNGRSRIFINGSIIKKGYSFFGPPSTTMDFCGNYRYRGTYDRSGASEHQRGLYFIKGWEI